MTDQSIRRSSNLLVVILILAALLPVSWLLGRRSAPATEILPILLTPGVDVFDLQESPGGIAGTGTRLPAPADGQQSYRLRFLLEAPKREARPPYTLRLEGPDGRAVWRGTWTDPEHLRTPQEIVVPTVILTSGRHSLRIENADRRIRSYPFVVP